MPNQKKRQKLTKRLIDSLTPQNQEFTVWDTECPGFGIRVLMTGTKSFLVSYRDERGRSRKSSLGRYPQKPVDKARGEARAVFVDLKRGYDQFDQAKQRKLVPTVEEFWPVYLHHHAQKLKAKSSVKDDISLWTTWIEPEFGKSYLDEITYKQIAGWHASANQQRVRANRALALLSKLMSIALKYDYIQRNPCTGVTKNPENSRAKFLSAGECKLLLQAADADHDIGAATIMKLLMFTGGRLGEALKADWSEFDLTGRNWKVPSSNLKGGVRHKIEVTRSLAEPVVTALVNWQNCSGKKTGLVFPSTRGPEHARHDIKAFWKRVLKRNGIEGLRIHDFRHTFASLALEAGMTLDKVGKEMGHRNQQTTSRYAHLMRDRKETAADLVAAQVIAQMVEQPLDSETS